MGLGQSPPSQARAEIIGTVSHVQVFGDWGIAFLNDEGNGPRPPRIVGARVAKGALVAGTRYRIFGRCIEHPKYGPQIEAERISEFVEATDGAGLARYLSRALAGVGESTAQKIVAWYQAGPGLDVLRQHIESSPEKIAELPFLSERTRVDLSKRSEAGAGDNTLAVFGARLAGAGPIPSSLIEALVAEHVAGALKAGVPGHKVPAAAWADYAANPYGKVGRLRGYGFRIADLAGRHIGVPKNDPRRLTALGRYALDTGCEGYGHVYLTQQQLGDFIRSSDPGAPVAEVMRLLRESPQLAAQVDGRWYPPYHLRNELYAAERLSEMLEGEPLALGAGAALAEAEQASGLPLSDEQRTALAGILSAPKRLHTLTAGPGCGKTAVVEVLALALLKHGWAPGDIAFCAPTGKAAKVLTGRLQKYRCFFDATTVHRLLEAGVLGFGRGEDNPLTQKLIVVDEFSMIDLALMASLLAAVPEGTHVLMIGDPGQLPSVGSGSVLADVLRLPADHHRLTQVFRNSGNLLDYIHSIGKGEPRCAPGAEDVVLRGDPGDDEAAFEQVVNTHLIALERQRKLAPNENPLSRVLLLCARRKGKREEPGWNITYLNAVLQDRLNPNGAKISGSHFRAGDRVILRENAVLPDAFNVEVPVFNGDTGFIHNGRIQLDSGESVIPPKNYLRDSVQLAYALTVHVSQGSEYPEVILVQKDGSPVLANRELLYTGASRAKSRLTVFGDPRLIGRACARRASRRNSGLVERVQRHLAGHLSPETPRAA